MSFLGVLGTLVSDKAKDVLKDIVRDATEDVLTGKRSLQEWSEIVEPVVDKIIEKEQHSQDWEYIGGKLKFKYNDERHTKIDITYELYFIDVEENWHKINASSDVNANTFTDDALEEIKANDEVSYEITGD
jgi:hypothetical protein